MSGAEQRTTNIYRMALLVAIACVLQISESLIPHPIPGLRLGLANVLTVTALVNLGFGCALELAILRTLLSAFILGTFMSPGFILSFSGAVVSALTMGALYWLSGLNRRYRLSLVGISIVGALSHNVTQLCLAYLILVRHKGIFAFFPWLGIGAVLTGWLTGAVASAVCRKLQTGRRQVSAVETPTAGRTAPTSRQYLKGSSFLHRLPAEIKIISILILSLAVLVWNDLWVTAALFSLIVVVVVLSRTSFTFLLCRFKKYSSLLLIAFLLPVLFNSGRHSLMSVGSFQVTSEGLSTGVLLAWRILCLVVLSTLLLRTTSAEELARGLARVLSPLRVVGISGKRTATILSLSLTAIPVVGERVKNMIRVANLKKPRNLRQLVPLLSDLVAVLYAEPEVQGVKQDSSGSLQEEN